MEDVESGIAEKQVRDGGHESGEDCRLQCNEVDGVRLVVPDHLGCTTDEPEVVCQRKPEALYGDVNIRPAANVIGRNRLSTHKDRYVGTNLD